MNLIMKAEVYKDGSWQPVDRVFKSALLNDLETDRVCDARCPILCEILGHHNTCGFDHTPIKPLPHVTEDDYSITYLGQILYYNWDTQIFKYGYISEFQYKLYKENKMEPVNILQRVRYKQGTIVDPFQMDMIAQNPTLRWDDKYYVRYQHSPQSLKEYCEFFCNESIPALIRLVPDGHIDYVRIKYKLDN